MVIKEKRDCLKKEIRITNKITKLAKWWIQLN